MLLAQVKEAAEAVEPLWQKAAEFGVLAFILVVFGGAILTGGAFVLWRLGNRFLDMHQTSLDHQAKGIDRSADAAVVTASAMERVADSNETITTVVTKLEAEHLKSQRASRYMLEALKLGLPESDHGIRDALAKAKIELE